MDRPRLVDRLYLTAKWCAIIAAAIALVALLGWALNVTILTRFVASWIPMAPSAALGLLLLNASLLLCAKPEHGSLARFLASSAAALAVTLSLLIALQLIAGFDLGIEAILARRPEPFGQVVTGRMSPVTAGMLTLIGLGILAPLLWQGRRRSWGISAMLAGSAFAIAGTIAVGYAFGTPLLYGGTTIPVSLPTGLACLSTSVGLFSLAVPEVGVLREFFLSTSVRARLGRTFLPFSAILALLVSWLNHFLASSSRTNPALWASLAAIVAGLLAAGIALFLAERTANAIEQAKTALQEGEMAALFGSVADAVTLTDTRRRIVLVNPAFSKLFGYSPEEIKGRTSEMLYANPADYAEQGRQRYNTAAAQAPAYEVSYRRKDGTTFIAESLGASVHGAEGKVVGFLGVHRDVTERKQAEKDLLDSQTRYRALFDHMSSGVAVYEAVAGGQDFVFKDFNESGARIEGMKREDAIGKSLLKVFPEVQALGFLSVLQRVWQTGRPERFSMKLYVDERRAGWRENYVYRLPAGEVVAVYEDVTERTMAQQALEASEARYRRIVETANEGVRAADAQDSTTFVNPKIAELLDCSVEEMLVRPITDFMFEEDRPDHHLRMLERQRGNPGRYERRFRRRDGSEVWVLVSATAIQDDDGNYAGSFAMLTDITDRRRAEQELRKVQKLESLGVLAGGIAHDFNNILMGILGNLSMAKAYVPEGADASPFLETAERATLRARQLTQQLLTFAKGGAPIKKVASIAELAVESATFALSGTQSRPLFSVGNELWPVEVDGGQISQVIHNIVLNADQAMPGGGIVELAAKNLSVEDNALPPLPAGNYVCLSIRDHGIGIPPEIQSRIFDPYFTTKETGSGLGLAAAYSIIQAHGGHIAVESQPGAGATFWLYLPAAPQATCAEPAEPDRVERGSGRLLFMDDDETICEIAGRMLTSLGYSMTFAADGRQAAELYRQALAEGKRFDLVIMDLTIPGGLGGKETVALLKELDPDVRAIVSSGYSTDPVMSDYDKFGFQGVITKPYTLTDLSWAVHRVLHAA